MEGSQTENGQTKLDVSQGDVRITSGGATLNATVIDDTLNGKGYWITGTTTKNNLVVEPGVSTALTLDNVNITVDTTKLDCINVSHADVVITLVGKNHLYIQAGGTADRQSSGNTITKDGMDGSLTIPCENADKKGHRCDESCGSLSAKGDPSKMYAGAIGGTYRVAINPDTKPIETGFVNFTIKGGNIEASAGAYCPENGAACRAQERGGYTKNILISGGNIAAVGTQYGYGIGSGMGTKVDGIRITGGTVKAKGGQYAPGIGASGTSLTDYTSMDGTPFSGPTDIKAGRFYTKVYFKPSRDANDIDKTSKEQIGANHLMSKSGGEPFGDDEIKKLGELKGKDADGNNIALGDYLFDAEQYKKIND